MQLDSVYDRPLPFFTEWFHSPALTEARSAYPNVPTEPKEGGTGYEPDPLGYVPCFQTGGGHGDSLFKPDVWKGTFYIELTHELAEAGLPVGLMIRHHNCPFPEDHERSQPDALEIALENAARVDYVLMDIEGSDDEFIHKNVLATAHIARKYGVQWIGNYGCVPNETNPTRIWPTKRDLGIRSSIYHEAELNVAMPICYTSQADSVLCEPEIQGDTGVCPNPRYATLWGAVEQFSATERDMMAEHVTMPWVGDHLYVRGARYNAPRPSLEDYQAMAVHLVMRGADQFYLFNHGMRPELRRIYRNVWRSFEPVFRYLGGRPETLATEKESGVMVSSVVFNSGRLAMVSNMTDEVVVRHGQEVEPWTHSLWRE